MPPIAALQMRFFPGSHGLGDRLSDSGVGAEGQTVGMHGSLPESVSLKRLPTSRWLEDVHHDAAGAMDTEV